MLDEWLRRAKDLYLERERVAGMARTPKERSRGRSAATVWRAYSWFVRLHVLNRLRDEKDRLYQAQVAREARVHPSCVTRDIRYVIGALEADNYTVAPGRKLGAKDLRRSRKREQRQKPGTRF